jgi:two-component system OmpR family response regulator
MSIELERMTNFEFGKSSGGSAAQTGSASRHILVVEDNPSVRRMLCTMFQGEGYVVSEARCEAEVLARLDRGRLSLITLDLALGGEDGLAIARKIRAKSDVPIIMVTAKAEDVDRIVGLEVGADDYVVKPFNIREVLARVRAVLRRTEAALRADDPSGPAGFRFEEWELNIAERQLRRSNGKPADLTSSEFELLEAFVRRPQRVLSRDALIDLVGGHDAEPLERSIDTLVGRLRRKIERDVKNPQLVKTVRGSGYVFAVKVQPF